MRLSLPRRLALPEASLEEALLAEPLALALELELPLADELAPEFEAGVSTCGEYDCESGYPERKRGTAIKHRRHEGSFTLKITRSFLSSHDIAGERTPFLGYRVIFALPCNLC